MKKLIFTLLISIISINFVYADETLSSFYGPNTSPWNTFEESSSIFSQYSSEVQSLISYYQTNFSSLATDYVIEYEHASLSSVPNATNIIVLYPLTTNNINTVSNNNLIWPTLKDNNNKNRFIMYSIDNGSYRSDIDIHSSYPSINYTPNPWGSVYLSSQQLYWYGSSTLIIPSYSSNNWNIPSYELEYGDKFPTIQNLENNFEPSPTADYVEIDLSQYSYIILSLKDYSLRNEDINQFYTNIYTFGQLCLTPVYNYGMQQKQELYPGYQVQSCTEIYNTYTPVSVYITKSDLQNHSVFYINNFNNNINNKIKVDTSIFNISYITSQNENNPTVTINGRSYPTIPYNDLTDTAINSTNEGYISGQTCALGDLNCMQEATGVSFDDVFSSPLFVLKSVWTSIITVFTIITQFITLLPPTLQTFMYLSFMLAVILGIIKIIL